MSRPVEDPVPIGPFADWCRELIARHERNRARQDIPASIRGHRGALDSAARAIGVNASQLRRWTNGHIQNSTGTISIARVDEVLVREGSTHVDDLYPLPEPAHRYDEGRV